MTIHFIIVPVTWIFATLFVVKCAVTVSSSILLGSLIPTLWKLLFCNFFFFLIALKYFSLNCLIIHQTKSLGVECFGKRWFECVLIFLLSECVLIFWWRLFKRKFFRKLGCRSIKSRLCWRKLNVLKIRGLLGLSFCELTNHFHNVWRSENIISLFLVRRTKLT